MQPTHWLKVLGAILVVNAALVLVTSCWHLATAQESPATSTSSESPDAPDSNRESDARFATAPVESDSPSLRQPHSEEDATPASLPPVLDSLPPPGVTDVPSLSTEELARDPVFQQFQEMIEEQADHGLLSPPALPHDDAVGNPSMPADFAAGLSAPVDTDGGFGSTYEHSDLVALATRLETIERLVTSARGLTAEAAVASSRHQVRQAKQLMGMVNQLRTMAAQLLNDPAYR